MPNSIDHYRRLLAEQLPLLTERYRVASLELFGSQVRGDSRTGSDLDVLVSFHRPPSLFRFIELEQYLSDLLSIKVDLVLRDSLKPHIGQRILAEATPI
jgi:predicted nucleotidyltransferase